MMKIKCTNHKLSDWFTSGKEYKAWVDNEGDTWSDSDVGLHVCHSTLTLSRHGVFEIVKEEKSHPHADLMLKYAMIAQYDDKPWESFEVFLDGEWVDCEHEGLYAGIEYRLKPQEPKIQVGQVWADGKGVEVTVRDLSNDFVFANIEVGGLTIPWSLFKDYFLQNFKLKEDK